MGRAAARRAREGGERVVALVRSEASAAALRAEGFEVVAEVPAEGDVLVCFPPDGKTDAALAPRLQGRALVYVSTTSVYGGGVVDDATPVLPAPSPRVRARLDAEEAWRAAGATVLRCPGIYGPDRGLHRRVIRGEHRLPGDGSAFLSRIHVDDLASLLLAARRVPGETFVVGDREPASQAEVCAWIARTYDVPMPPSVPIEEVHETLRGDRRVDGSRALARLGVTLRYPTYREGMRRPDD